LLGDAALVDQVLCDYQNAPLSDRDRALLALVEKIVLQPNGITEADMNAAREAEWTDEAIYDAITVCALFKFYNTWNDAAGVGALPPEGYAMSGKRLAVEGYARKTP
jgi:alkylhydroperoxidase family enzyme